MRKPMISLGAVVALTGLTACGGGVSVPNPTPQDYANQATMESAHPGMDCVMEWVDPGQYMTNCYPMTYHPPYSVRVYYPRGCTCPSLASRPSNYRAPRPVVVHKTTTVTIHHP